MSIYSLLGEKINTIVDESKSEGQYEVIWDGKNVMEQYVASGVYLCQIEFGDFVQNRKLLLIR